jgi:hypothetical protein
VERIAARSYADSLGELRPFSDVRRWNYTAPVVTAGFRWDAPGGIRLAGSILAGGELDANASAGAAEDHTYGAPLELSVGTSARFSRLWSGTAGLVWARTPSGSDSTVSRDGMRVGGGLEYGGVRSGSRTYPIRLGARWSQLPYHLDGETAPTEMAFGMGLGFLLGEPADPAAVADISLERASRSGLDSGAIAGGLEERLWRFTFSLSLFGR